MAQVFEFRQLCGWWQDNIRRNHSDSWNAYRTLLSLDLSSFCAVIGCVFFSVTDRTYGEKQEEREPARNLFSCIWFGSSKFEKRSSLGTHFCIQRGSSDSLGVPYWRKRNKFVRVENNYDCHQKEASVDSSELMKR